MYYGHVKYVPQRLSLIGHPSPTPDPKAGILIDERPFVLSRMTRFFSIVLQEAASKSEESMTK